MAVTGSISILIIALLCLAVYLARRAAGGVGRGKLGWFLAAYFTVLISSPMVLQLLPAERLLYPVDAATLQKVEAAARDLFPAAMAGRPESVDGVRKLGEWQFSFTGHSLSIAGTLLDTSLWTSVVEKNGEFIPYTGLIVLVERKDENDGIIEATHYFSGAILEMIDVSAQVRPAEITLTDNTLRITEPEYYKIEVLRFRQDFMAAQILGDGASAWQPVGIDVIGGEQLLYLRIPRGVHVEEPHYHLQFVELN
jgi:hypothetical protein